MASDVAIELPAGAAVPAEKTGRKRLTLIIAAVVVVALASFGVRRWLFGRSHESTDDAQVDGHITAIAPKVQAFVDRVLVDDNEQVTVGDTLVVLDARDLTLRLQAAEADLATAQAAVGTARRTGQAQAEIAVGRAQAAGAEASVASAEAAFRKAAADLERYRGLAAQKVIAAQQLDAAQAAYDAARANLDAAKRQAAAAGSQVTAFSAALTGAEARLASAQSAVDNARLQISYTVITAPQSGTIAKRSVEPGALVQVGQSLMSIVPDSDLWVTANFKETQLKNIRVGDRAEFTVDAYSGREFTGRVESLSPATGARFALLPPDNATGNFTKVVQRVPVRIAVDNPANPAAPLRPGMSVDVTVTTKR
jgi:membrane fusion protein (multidrug efflux system)